MDYCVLMYWGIPILIYDSTDAYATRQGNNHYIYHNAAIQQLPENACRLTRKGPESVRTDLLVHILACVDRV